VIREKLSLNEYQQRALATADEAIHRNPLYAAVGISGEAGEVLDYIKKVHFHGHALDKQKLVKELGDVLWYLAAAADSVSVSLEEVAEANLKKLAERYPNGFTKERSINRKEET
jgi:NTP pyrophosphatase (non-canonical NTP hydrolase)